MLNILLKMDFILGSIEKKTCFYNNFAKFLNISYFCNPLLINLLIKWSCGRVARLSSAKAATAVRIRSGPH